MMWLLHGLLCSALAATFDGPPMTLDDLVDHSARVVVGEVRSTESVSGGPGIETIVEVHVSETLHGAASPVVSFRVPGGSLSGIDLTISGAPRFSTGDAVVVFLGDDGQIVGFNQGAFRFGGDMVWSSVGDSVQAIPYEELRRILR